MAIRLVEEYPNRVGAPTAEYPHGVPRNKSTPTATDGTPFEQSWFRDQEGFFQGLLETAGITPSGTSDTVEQSDYLDALTQIANGVTDIDVGGAADVTISVYQGRISALRLTGTLSGDIDLIVPDVNRLYWIVDDTAGDFSVTAKTELGTGVALSSGMSVLRCDGTDVFRADTVTTGTGEQTVPEALDQRVIFVDTIADLQALPTSGLVDGQKIFLKDDRDAASSSSGMYEYNSNKLKSEHDGWSIISPTVPFSQTAIDAKYKFNAGEGETDPSGSGCYGLVSKSAYKNEYTNYGLHVDEEINFEAYSALIKNATTPLTIPTYVAGNDEVVHPSVVYINGGFAGYPYWMAATPYANTDNQTENPSVWASHDGKNWAVPAGATNPIFGPTAGADYYSDVGILYNQSDNSLSIYWRLTGDGEKFLISKSFDGINWTPFEVFYEFNSPDYRGVSPSIVYADGTYYLWYVSIGNAVTGQVVTLDTAKNIMGPWDGPQNVSISSGPASIWHLEVQNIGRRFVMLAQSGGSGGGSLYIGTSPVGGLSFSFQESALLSATEAWEGATLYKSSFLLSRDSRGTLLKIWYGSTSGGDGWKIGYTEYRLSGKLLTGSGNGMVWNYDNNVLTIRGRTSVDVVESDRGETTIDLSFLPASFNNAVYDVYASGADASYLVYANQQSNTVFAVGTRHVESVATTTTRFVEFYAVGFWG